jgi:hypothetical protein
MTQRNNDSAPFEKKTERLDVRISHEKKKAFVEACENQGDIPSNAIRRFISTYIRREQRDEMAAAIRFSPWKRYMGYFAIGGIMTLGAIGIWSAVETQRSTARAHDIFAGYDKNRNNVIDLGEIAPNDYHLHRVLNIDGVDGISPSEFRVNGRMMWQFVNPKTFKILENTDDRLKQSSTTSMTTTLSVAGVPIDHSQKKFIKVEGEFVELNPNLSETQMKHLLSEIDRLDRPSIKYSDAYLEEKKKYASKMVEFDLSNPDRVNITAFEQQIDGTAVQTFSNYQRSVDWVEGRATPEFVMGQGREKAILTARGN